MLLGLTKSMKLLLLPIIRRPVVANEFKSELTMFKVWLVGKFTTYAKMHAH